MIPHEIILPFSAEWWIYNLITIILIATTICVGRNLSEKRKKTLTLVMVYLFIFDYVFMDFYNIYNGLWSIQESSLCIYAI